MASCKFLMGQGSMQNETHAPPEHFKNIIWNKPMRRRETRGTVK